jgi:hypothetical protein
MSEQSYVAKFVHEKLPILSAFHDVLPVWRHLVFRTAAFFDVVRATPNLSIKNAIVFCLSSATLMTAALVSADKISEVLVELISDKKDYKPLTISAEIIFEVLLVVYILVVGAISTIVTFIPSRILSREVRLKKVFVGTLYMSTFLLTINAFLAVILMVWLLFSQYQVSYSEVFTPVFVHDNPQEPYPLHIWKITWLMWAYFAAPTFSLTAAAHMTGVPARRLYIFTLIILICAVLGVILICFLAYLLFGAS